MVEWTVWGSTGTKFTGLEETSLLQKGRRLHDLTTSQTDKIIRAIKPILTRTNCLSRKKTSRKCMTLLTKECYSYPGRIWS